MASFNLTTWFVDRHLDEGAGTASRCCAASGNAADAELAALVNRIGHVLRDLGVRQEERVLLALGDSIEFVASWYAAQKIGAVTAEAYTFLPAKDFAYYLEYTRAGVVIVDATTLDRIRAVRTASPWLRTLLVVGPLSEPLSVPVRRASTRSSRRRRPSSRRRRRTLTTSRSGVHDRLDRQAEGLRAPDGDASAQLRALRARRPGMSGDDVVLPVPKLFFGYARDLTALYPFGLGGAGIVFSERSTAARIFELIERHRPTMLVNVPTMIRAMLEQPERDLSSLRLCTSAGEALPEELHRRWSEAFGIELLDGIGSSEAYHIYISSRRGAARPGTLGTVVPGYRARIVDHQQRDVADGEVGRLWIEGDTAALMYWGAREQTVATYAGDTVMSGDLFSRDSDGYFQYRGRADDLLKVGGIWVAPQEIERCLADHPAVAECAVRRLRRGRSAEAAGVRGAQRGGYRRRRGAAGARQDDALAAQVSA